MASPPGEQSPDMQAAAASAAMALATTELEYRVELLNKWVRTSRGVVWA